MPITERLSRALGGLRLAETANGAAIALVLASLALFIGVIATAVSTPFWRHDDLAYLYTFETKLIQDGRWAIAAGYDALRRLDPVGVWLVNAVLYAVASGVIARDAAIAFHGQSGLGQSATFLAVFAAIFAAPAFLAQNHWPLSLLPGFALLAAIALLARRDNALLLVPLGALLLGGALQSLIFMLPLFWVFKYLNGADRPARRFALLAASWVGGFVLSLLVMNLMVQAMAGQGLQPADWRRMQALSGFSDVPRAIAMTWRETLKALVLFGWPGLLLALLGLAGFAMRLRADAPDWTRIIGGVVLCGMVAAAVFALTVFLGTAIAPRTLLTTLVGGVCLLQIAPPASLRPVANVATAALACLFALQGYKVQAGYQRTATEVTSFFRTALEPVALPGDLIVLHTEDQRAFHGRFHDSAWGLSIGRVSTQPYRYAQALVALGYERRMLCPWRQGEALGTNCDTYLAMAAAQACNERPVCVVRLDATTVLLRTSG